MSKMANGFRHERGFSIVELMIAMLLGLFVSSVVISIFVSTNRSFAQDQELARMQENARYAMRVLASDLSMVGFWGRVLDPGKINSTLRDCDADGSGTECQGEYAGTSLTLDTDCGPGSVTPAPPAWAYDVTTPLEILVEASAADAGNSFDCIDQDEFHANTDVLVIKRVQGQGLASTRADSGDNGKIFLRATGAAGMLVDYDHAETATTGANILDWSYVARIYYVQDHFTTDGDGIPSLFRKNLGGSAGAAAMQTEGGGVAPGIEYFHVMFGVDTDDPSDGAANVYTSSPSASEFDNAVTARIYVLARSLQQDHSYTNNKVYQLGDVTKDYSGSPDKFYRRVFSTTVKLRNQANRALLNP